MKWSKKKRKYFAMDVSVSVSFDFISAYLKSCLICTHFLVHRVNFTFKTNQV